jgi:hypothetical protein
MKKKNKLLNRFSINLLIAVGLITIGCSSNNLITPLEENSGEEDLYFWGGMNGDEKIYLNLDPFRRLYRLESADEADEIIKELKSQSPELNIQVMPIGENFFLLISKDDISVNFPDSEKIKYQIPVYASKKTGFTYFFDGVIILRPKEGANISEILNREAGIKLKKQLLSGTIFCSVEDGDKVLAVANRIYENGLVEFSYPNYIPPIELH